MNNVQAENLRAAIDMLRQLRDEALRESCGAFIANGDDDNSTRHYGLGMVAAHCDAAADAVFAVLNVSSNYLGDKAARAALERHHDKVARAALDRHHDRTIASRKAPAEWPDDPADIPMMERPSERAMREAFGPHNAS